MGEGVSARIRELARRAGLRDVEPAVLVAAGVLCALACVWALWRWWPWSAVADEGSGASARVEAPAAGSEDDGAATAATQSVPASSAAVPAEVIVHVVGAVRHPGVYTLPVGSRAIDAVEAAGGLLGDAVVTGVNLASEVVDGQQVFVPDEDSPQPPGGAAASGAAAAAGTGAGGAGGTRGAPVDVNTADAAALEELPGIGPSTAAKIVADREANGPFGKVEDLMRVSGIGEKKFEGLKDFACVR